MVWRETHRQLMVRLLPLQPCVALQQSYYGS